MNNRKQILFLFPHQDDEFGVFNTIHEHVSRGDNVTCVYMTDGGVKNSTTGCRNNESLKVLQLLGVQEESIFFKGEELNIPDGKLPHYMTIVGHWLQLFLASYDAIDAIYIPAWEGGHQDHDALHVVTTLVTNDLGMIEKVKQFPLYNRENCLGPFFQVLNPLQANGLIVQRRIAFFKRLFYIRCCLSYPSQLLTWIGLFPFVLFHYLVKATESYQLVSINRLEEPPHQGVLLYEKRSFFSWLAMNEAIYKYRLSLKEDSSV